MGIFLLCAGILYLIAAILGMWSASLLWRAWHSWRLQRRGKLGSTRPVQRLSGARRGFGVSVALIALPIAGVAFAFGEVVRQGDSDRPLDYTNLLVQGVGAALAFMALGGFYVAWRFDPSMGRRRCPKCWYDMSATDGRLCPECGVATEREKSMFRTRRAPRIALLAVLFLVGGYSLHAFPAVREKGWPAAVPSTALIVGLPWWPDVFMTSGPASLYVRVEENRLWKWQQRLLERRCLAVARESDDMTAINNAAILLAACGNETTEVYLSPAGQVAFFTQFAADVASGAIPSWAYYTSRFLPPQLAPEASAIALPTISKAFNSRTAAHVHFAIMMAPSLGSEGTPLVAPLSAVANSATASGAGGFRWGDPASAVWCLGLLGQRNDAAWDAYLKLFDSPTGEIRVAAATWAMHFERRDESLNKRLEAALGDSSEEAARAAATSIVYLTGNLCDAAPTLAPLVRTRPWVLREVFDNLVIDCPNADVVEGLRALLLTREHVHIVHALRNLRHMGARAEPLLSTLIQLKDEGVLGGHYQVQFAEAIEAVETARRGSGKP